MGTSAIGGMNIVLSANAASFSAGIAQAQRQLNAFANAGKKAGHDTVSSMQAASASIRVLEGGMTGNIRAAERFISTIPGVGKALQAAFPLVGGIAVAGIFVKIGTEAAKFIETVNKAPQAIANSWRELNQSAETTNDTLAVTNDKLANEIAKLQGKPQNNLKLAIDEARVAADKLAESLTADNSRVSELLQRNHQGAAAGLLGKYGTSGVEGSISYYTQQFSDLGAQRNVAVHSGDTAAVARLDKAIADKQTAALNWAADQIKRDNNGGGEDYFRANINDLQGFQAQVLDRRDDQSLQATNTQMAKQKADIEAAKALQEAQKRMAELAKQAQEARVAQWRKDLDEAKADNDMTLAQEGQFWVRRIEASRKGSLSYNAALDEANKAIAGMRKENMAGGVEFDRLTQRATLPDAGALEPGAAEGLKTAGRDTAEWLRTLNQGVDIQRQNSSALAEFSLSMDLATGKVSRLDAAQQQAALHTREYEEAVKRLQAALAAVASNDGLSPAERAQATGQLNNQLSQAAGQRAIQAPQDQQAIAAQQIGPAMQQALGVMVNTWKDLASQITRVVERGVDGLNDNIVKAITGQKTNFGATFMQAGQGLLKAALQRGEGALLGSFGLGKADGSSEASALWVRMTSGVSGVAGGLGGLLGRFLPGFQGHFAGGGVLSAGGYAMVGERGPEMFVPRTAGTIVPNHMLGGGGTSHTYMIDARGAQDPAAIEAAVRRALPSAVAGSAQAMHQMARRSPQGR